MVTFHSYVTVYQRVTMSITPIALTSAWLISERMLCRMLLRRFVASFGKAPSSWGMLTPSTVTYCHPAKIIKIHGPWSWLPVAGWSWVTFLKKESLWKITNHMTCCHNFSCFMTKLGWKFEAITIGERGFTRIQCWNPRKKNTNKHRSNQPNQVLLNIHQRWPTIATIQNCRLKQQQIAISASGCPI